MSIFHNAVCDVCGLRLVSVSLVDLGKMITENKWINEGLAHGSIHFCSQRCRDNFDKGFLERVNPPEIEGGD